jgi:hypothetical protein
VRERKGKKLQKKAKGKKKKKKKKKTPSIPQQRKDPQQMFVCRHCCRCTRAIARALARLLARALSLLRPRSATAPPSCWDPTSTYYYVHAIEPSDRSHPLHRTVEDDGTMRSVLYKTYRIIYTYRILRGTGRLRFFEGLLGGGGWGVFITMVLKQPKLWASS